MRSACLSAYDHGVLARSLNADRLQRERPPPLNRRAVNIATHPCCLELAGMVLFHRFLASFCILLASNYLIVLTWANENGARRLEKNRVAKRGSGQAKRASRRAPPPSIRSAGGRDERHGPASPTCQTHKSADPQGATGAIKNSCRRRFYRF